MKKYLTLLIVPALMLTLILPRGAEAATQNLSIATLQQIVILYEKIFQLQMQLIALQSGTEGSVTTNQLAVQTESAKLVGGSYVEMNGRVTFKQSGDARIWFKYGPTSAMNDSTKATALDNKKAGSSFDYSVNVSGLTKNKTYYYRAIAEGEDNRFAQGVMKSFTYTGSNSSNNNNGNNNDPDVTTSDATNITASAARLEGSVDMNDFDNGYVFFVYGEDKNSVEDAADENQYSDIDTSGSDLKKIIVETSFDNDDTLTKVVSGLQDDTDIYYRLCVGYTDDNDDDALVCGDVESFTTDTN